MLTVATARERLGPSLVVKPFDVFLAMEKKLKAAQAALATAPKDETKMAAVRRCEEDVLAAGYESSFYSNRETARIFRDTRGQSGRPLTVVVAQQELWRLIGADRTVDSRAARYTEHVRELCRRHGQSVGFVDTPTAWVSGSAWRARHHIETPRIVGPWDYATALHELGHNVSSETDCRARRHVRVKTPLNLLNESVCPTCEVVSWRWARWHAIEWLSEMQFNLCQGLASYAKYASASQRADIHALMSKQ